MKITQSGFLKLTKSALISYLIIFFALSGSGLFFLFNPFGVKSADAAWFNDNWGYRQEVPITANTGADTNTYISFSLDTATLITAGKLQSSCQDIRITDQGGNILAYRVGRTNACNNAATTIDALVPLLAAGASTFYVYYGNPSVASKDNGAFSQSEASTYTVGTLGSSVAGPNPTLYWQFEQSQGSTAEDSTTNGLDGTTSSASSGIAFGAHTNTTYGSGNSVTFSHTTSGSDRVLIVVVPYWNATALLVTGITYNSVALTLVGRSAASPNSSNDRVEIWQLIAPATGANNVVITFDPAQANYVGGASATSFTGAHQTTPTGTFASATGTSTTSTLTVTSASDEIVVDGVALDAVSATLTMATQTGRTERQNVNSGGELVGHSTQTSPGTSEVMDWTNGASKDWAMAGVSVKPSGNANLTTVTNLWKTEDFCVAGKCLQFTGSSNNNVNKSDDAKLDFVAADNFTLSAWVKRNGASSAASYIMTKAQSGYTGYKMYMDASGDFCFDVKDGTNTDSACTSAVDFDDDQWHFVEAVKAGTTSITLYVDGKQRAQDASIAATGTLANTGTFYAGIDLDGTGGWNGFIDEVKVYRDNTARTAAQVLADYNARSNPEGVSQQQGNNITNMPSALSNGLVGYWKLDESSGTAADSSGNSLTLTNNSSTAFGAGKFGLAGSFVAASTDYFSTATTVSGVKTVSFWTYNASTTDEYINLTSGAYITSSSGTVSATGFTSPTIYVNGVINGTLTASVWNHVAVTSDTAINANQFEVGRANASYNNGLIDDVRTYNRTLSKNEVAQLYNWAPGPILYWKFDENTGTSAFDNSGNGYTGALTNGPVWAAGKFGPGLNFDGINDSVLCTDSNCGGTGSNQLDMGIKSMTLSAWVKLDANVTGTGNMVLGKADGNGTDGYHLRINDLNQIDCVVLLTSDFDCADDGGTLTVGKWHHLALTIDRAGSIKRYLDGVKTGTDLSISAEPTFNANTDQDFCVGGRETGCTGRVSDENIDDAKVYNYARTPSQIIEDMNAGHPAPGSPVGSAVGYWKMDEGYSTTANDSNSGTGGAENLTLSAASWTNSGKFGKALNGATNVRASVTDDPDLDFAAAEDLSISFWFKSDSATNPGAGINEYLVEKGGIVGTAAIGYAVYTSATTGLICFGIDDDAVSAFPEDETCSSSDIYDNTWHHFLAKKTGTSRLDLYVDGKPNGTPDTAISATGTLENTATFFVGDANSTDGTDEFLGDIDELKVFRSALTNSQVQVEYNQASSEVLGALSNKSGEQVQAAAQEYCIPGDTATCTIAGEWKFEEKTGTTANDTSINGNNGSISGAAWTSGKLGAALDYDGTDDVTTVTNASAIDLNTNTAHTFSVWVYADSAGEGSGGQIYNKGSTTFLRVDTLSGSNLDVEAQLDLATTDATLNISTAITTGTWNHIAVGYTDDADDEITIYVNGINKGSSTNGVGSIAAEANNLLIGGPTTDNFDGKIDQFRFFGYELSQAQASWDYNKGKPVGHWKMDECQGTVINDSSGNSLTGTLTIGASGSNTAAGTCTTSGAWFDGVTGKRNYSMDFDGTDDVVTVSTNSLLNITQDITIAGWIKRNTSSNARDEIMNKTDGVNVDYLLGICSSTSCTGGGSENNKLAFYADGVGTDVHSTGTISDTNWHHVMVTRASGTVRFYIDGNLDRTVTYSANFAANNIEVRIGKGENAASHADGLLDDVRLYNYALTAEQVRILYNDGAVRYGPVTGAP